MTILRKRALSSPAAVWRSLKRRLALLEAVDEWPRQLTLFEDDEVDDDVPDGALGAPGLADGARERQWLAALIEAAGAAVPLDSKLQYLQRLLRRVRHEPLIVFTEYRDTLLQLASGLPPALHLHGGLSAAEREEVQARFNAGGAGGGLLLATDAAAEGLNLQERCRLVVNYELPWNPARLEQRIGRVDRIGQRRAVHAVTLVARDTAEDLVVANLARRLGRVAATLGERDRLAAFLTDARTAGLLIGDEPADAAADAAAAATAVPEPDLLAAAARAAGHLQRAQTARRPSSDVLVGSLRSRTVPPGIAVCVRVSLATDQGDLIAARVAVLHASCAPAKPSAARARAMAADVINAGDLSASIPDLPDWMASVRSAHIARVERLLFREQAIGADQGNQPQIQPGLFDRRALGRAEEASLVREAVAEDHRRRVSLLTRARHLRLACAPALVLISWR